MVRGRLRIKQKIGIWGLITTHRRSALIRAGTNFKPMPSGYRREPFQFFLSCCYLFVALPWENPLFEQMSLVAERLAKSCSASTCFSVSVTPAMPLEAAGSVTGRIGLHF